MIEIINIFLAIVVIMISIFTFFVLKLFIVNKDMFLKEKKGEGK